MTRFLIKGKACGDIFEDSREVCTGTVFAKQKSANRTLAKIYTPGKSSVSEKIEPQALSDSEIQVINIFINQKHHASQVIHFNKIHSRRKFGKRCYITNNINI